MDSSEKETRMRPSTDTCVFGLRGVVVFTAGVVLLTACLGFAGIVCGQVALPGGTTRQTTPRPTVQIATESPRIGMGRSARLDAAVTLPDGKPAAGHLLLPYVNGKRLGGSPVRRRPRAGHFLSALAAAGNRRDPGRDLASRGEVELDAHDDRQPDEPPAAAGGHATAGDRGAVQPRHRPGRSAAAGRHGLRPRAPRRAHSTAPCLPRRTSTGRPPRPCRWWGSTAPGTRTS